MAVLPSGLLRMRPTVHFSPPRRLRYLVPTVGGVEPLSHRTRKKPNGFSAAMTLIPLGSMMPFKLRWLITSLLQNEGINTYYRLISLFSKKKITNTRPTWLQELASSRNTTQAVVVCSTIFASSNTARIFFSQKRKISVFMIKCETY